MMTKTLNRIAQFVAIPADNPELLKAQCAALSRQVPMAYLVMAASVWMLATAFWGEAPLALTVLPPTLLTGLMIVRLVAWWRVKETPLTTERATYELRHSLRLTVVNCLATLAWGITLFPFGDGVARYHLAHSQSLTAIGIMMCLTQLRAAPLIVAGIVGGSSATFFALASTTTFPTMAVNVALVNVAAVVIMLTHHRDFARMVNAQTEARHREQEQSRLLAMIDDMPVAVMTVAPGSWIINYANDTSKELIRKIEHLLPIKADDLIGTSIDVFHRDPQHQRRILDDPRNLPYNARIRLGPEVLDLKVSAVTADDGSYIGPMLTWALVTKEVEAENQIRRLAHYDTLTGLPNRFTFREDMAEELASPDNRVGLLYVDLDGFKLVNDARGHPVGDLLLGQVASRLRATCNGPAMTVGRLGGDEFAVLIPRATADSAAALAAKVIQTLSAPYDLDYDRRIQLGASIGIALAPDHGRDADALLARADMALYAAKAAGKGQACIFSPNLETRVQERVRLEAKLRDALANKNGLFVFYQPIVNIETGKVTAREALVRWHHPQRGWISPGEFVPVAEQSGLIDQLGQFVLEHACRDAVERADGARVAVNVSAVQLGKGTLAPVVLSALVGSGLAPNRLEIEVTETALLGAETSAIDDLRRLRDLGVRVALDDFGTGYSSLAHLRIFPFDKIKIDGSFVKEAVDRPECAAIVKAVADLGKRLGVTTVAEGVETQAQLDRVRQEGCTEIQGYLYGRPVPSDRDAATIEELNNARQNTVAA